MASVGSLKTAVRQITPSSASSLLRRTTPVLQSTCASRRCLSSVPRRITRHSPRSTYSISRSGCSPKRHSSSTSWLLSALPNLAASSPPQTIHASRVLPYPPAQVYNLIADVGAYRTFLPHCSSSLVRAWASPPAGQQPQDQEHGTIIRAPALADLTAGWGPFTETYTSRVYCVPPGKASAEDGAGVGIVEAVSGKAATTLSPEVLEPLGYDEAKLRQNAAMPFVESGLFESLVTRWTVRPLNTAGATEQTSEVTLTVKFQFVNAMLGHAVGQLAKEKANEMIQAFETRARQLYGKKGI
ncbi:dehydrase and lipid transport-domain-containing protein [Rhypophila decipiens]|uniref:Dehydrase and lipid transport-domain-containing protein n=1 Tax=Rhypophila decipiens TaxID=261697 RepID=A0AAN6Y5C4_9PEZI|nr:dehydrase and lipid transport-domain-containing protein [Rhypophila decipiens]